MKFTITIICILSIFAILSSCSKNSKEAILEGLEACDTTSTAYSAEIKPILDQFCNTSGCHNATSVAAGYNFESYDNVKNAALGSRFLGSIRHESGFSSMPKGSDKLTDCQIQKIEIWVRKGAQNN